MSKPEPVEVSVIVLDPIAPVPRLRSLRLDSDEYDILNVIKRQLHTGEHIANVCKRLSWDLVRLITQYLNGDSDPYDFYLEYMIVGPTWTMVYPEYKDSFVLNHHLKKFGWKIHGLAVLFQSNEENEIEDESDQEKSESDEEEEMKEESDEDEGDEAKEEKDEKNEKRDVDDSDVEMDSDREMVLSVPDSDSDKDQMSEKKKKQEGGPLTKSYSTGFSLLDSFSSRKWGESQKQEWKRIQKILDQYISCTQQDMDNLPELFKRDIEQRLKYRQQMMAMGNFICI